MECLLSTQRRQRTEPSTATEHIGQWRTGGFTVARLKGVIFRSHWISLRLRAQSGILRFPRKTVSALANLFPLSKFFCESDIRSGTFLNLSGTFFNGKLRLVATTHSKSNSS
jgi:hypothetical protein